MKKIWKNKYKNLKKRVKEIYKNAKIFSKKNLQMKRKSINNKAVKK